MAEEIAKGAGAPAGEPTPTSVPEIPIADRLTVPASAVFDETDAPKTDAPKTDAPKTDAPKTDAPKTDAPKTDAPKTDAPKTVKIGGKEYTEAELEKALAERANQPQSQTPPAAKAPEQKEPTPEEIQKAESDWCSRFSETEKLDFTPTEEQVETLLSGGPDAAKFLATTLNSLCAKAVMLARKSIYADMNPTLADIQQRLEPLISSNVEVERAAAEHQFFATYPQFKDHAETARQVADALFARFPHECSKMTREQLMAEVASQADRILQTEFKRWNPNATGTWQDALKPAPAAAAPAAAAPAAVKPPAANSPAATPTGGVTSDWHKQTAESLVD